MRGDIEVVELTAKDPSSFCRALDEPMVGPSRESTVFLPALKCVRVMPDRRRDAQVKEEFRTCLEGSVRTRAGVGAVGKLRIEMD